MYVYIIGIERELPRRNGNHSMDPLDPTLREWLEGKKDEALEERLDDPSEEIVIPDPPR